MKLAGKGAHIAIIIGAMAIWGAICALTFWFLPSPWGSVVIVAMVIAMHVHDHLEKRASRRQRSLALDARAAELGLLRQPRETDENSVRTKTDGAYVFVWGPDPFLFCSWQPPIITCVLDVAPVGASIRDGWIVAVHRRGAIKRVVVAMALLEKRVTYDAYDRGREHWFRPAAA